MTDIRLFNLNLPPTMFKVNEESISPFFFRALTHMDSANRESRIQFTIRRIYEGDSELPSTFFSPSVEGENRDSVGENRVPNGIAILRRIGDSRITICKGPLTLMALQNRRVNAALVLYSPTTLV